MTRKKKGRELIRKSKIKYPSFIANDGINSRINNSFGSFFLDNSGFNHRTEFDAGSHWNKYNWINFVAITRWKCNINKKSAKDHHRYIGNSRNYGPYLYTLQPWPPHFCNFDFSENGIIESTCILIIFNIGCDELIPPMKNFLACSRPLACLIFHPPSLKTWNIWHEISWTNYYWSGSFFRMRVRAFPYIRKFIIISTGIGLDFRSLQIYWAV